MPVFDRAHLNDPVTNHMRREFSHVAIDQTVNDALAGFRLRPTGERIIYFYVLDADGKLCGVLPTRRLLLSAPETPVADIMVRHVIAIPTNATVLEACEFFTLHRLLAFPIIDEQRRMIGVVDVELYTEELGDLGELEHREQLDNLFQLVGVHLTQAQPASALAAFRGRFPWLLCNISGGILAAFISGLFEEELERVVALAMFIPVVLALAESVSIQSVSLALPMLQGKTLNAGTVFRMLRVELLTGLLLGVASGGVVALVALIWMGNVKVMLSVFGGIAGGVTGAALFGLAMPIVLRLLRREPQVAAGPIALAAADMLTLLLYFNLARWLLG